jgi:hypothetical protein
VGIDQKSNDAADVQKRPQDDSVQAAGRLLKGEPDSQPEANQPDAAENEQRRGVKLTREQAEALLRGDLGNLVKKVKAGKPLSASERNLLNSSLDGGIASAAEYVDNVIELAELLGVTRRTISRWKKVEGNPGTRTDGRYHVPAWREFKRNRDPEADADDGEEIDGKKERARNILLQNERLEVQIAVLKRHWMPTAEVERMGGELGAAIRKVVSQIHLAAPNVVGVSVAEAAARLKEIEDEVLQQLHLLDDSVNNWKNSVDEPAA